MGFKSEKSPTVGLVEVPALGLYDPDCNNWTVLYRKNTLLSKQVLLTDLQALKVADKARVF